MRKLASIQRIKSLESIPEADAIEKATVLGWELVVKKGEFKPGDLCVYCEIDSLFPEKPEFEFLKPRGMRIRTIRLRGQISQGICLPLSILPVGTESTEGSDVTEILGITKYEAPVFEKGAKLAGEFKGFFPNFIPKTDETRVQVLQELLDKYKNTTCFVTEKLDGTSATFYVKNGEFGVCSRNYELIENEENAFWQFAREVNLKEKLNHISKNFALQGELIGEGIQQNRYKIQGRDVRFFNAFDIDRFSFLAFREFMELMEQLNLKTVPVLETDFKLSNDIPFLVEKARAKSVLNSEVWREGIVIRPIEEKYEYNYGRVSFKSINPEFLLKYE